MKTLATLLAGALLAVLILRGPQLLAVNYPNPTPATTAPAAAPAAPVGTGTIVHPVSKNITDRLTKSTRHMDFVKIKQGDREVGTYIYYPTDRNKAMTVVLVHEIFGLSDWMRAAADQLAEAGYVVLVPDLLSGLGPNKGGTDDLPESQITASVTRLDPAQVLTDLDAVVAYAKKLPECDGNVAVGGFCWGGGKAFALAAHNQDLKAAFVFYGAPMLPVAQMPNIHCPVYGFYGEVDRNLAGAVPAETAAMKAAGKVYDAVVYPGAHHGFMRLGQMDNPGADDKKAAEDAWKRWLDLLKKTDTPSAAAPAAPAATK